MLFRCEGESSATELALDGVPYLRAGALPVLSARNSQERRENERATAPPFSLRTRSPLRNFRSKSYLHLLPSTLPPGHKPASCSPKDSSLLAWWLLQQLVRLQHAMPLPAARAGPGTCARLGREMNPGVVERMRGSRPAWVSSCCTGGCSDSTRTTNPPCSIY